MAMATEAWLHFFGHHDAAISDGIATALAHTGMNTRELTPTIEGGWGILCFGEFSEGLCEILCEVSQHGMERVLAVAVSDAGLTHGHIWQLLHAGASDIFICGDLQEAASRIVARFERWSAIEHLLNSALVTQSLVGTSPAWRFLLRKVIEVARFTDASVLITGETSTGKELLARLLHELDPRTPKGDLVLVDCTTIVPELSGSEFFGHERGAFTGAVNARESAFALADAGTLFLDEVGELPPGLQAQLLRVIQEHQYKRVGGNTWQHTDFRLVCATNRDLSAGVTRGEFRSDLYYRIAGWVVRTPPLRDRREDILPLARHFLGQLRPGIQPPDFDGPVREYLLRRDYPGNVRDLKQLVWRIGHRHVGPGPITVGDIPEEERLGSDTAVEIWRSAAFENTIRQALAMGQGLKKISDAASEAAIRIAIGEEDGNLKRAAKRLDVTDRALQLRRAHRRLDLCALQGTLTPG
jgi:transcriptional regulator with GAF, ATPase, and Fis domain